MDKNKIKNLTLEKLKNLFPNQKIITKNDIDIIFNNVKILDKSSISKILNILIKKIKNDKPKNVEENNTIADLLSYAKEIPKIESLEIIDNPQKKEIYNNQLEKSNKTLNEYNDQLKKNLQDPKSDTVYTPLKLNIKESEGKIETQYVILDSKDRDLEEFPNANNYSINFDEDITNKKGFIKGKLINIKSIELIDCIIINDFPDKNYPYILVNIEEIFGKSLGSNSYLSNSFCKLSSYTTSGIYRYYNFKNTNYNPKIIFDVNKSFEKFTVSFLSPSGELINFEDNDNKDLTKNSLTFKIEIEKFNLQDKFPDYS